MATQTGTAGNDSLSGGSLDNNWLRGLGGNDTLAAGQNSDTLEGGDGDDELRIAATAGSRAWLDGGAGDDLLVIGALSSAASLHWLGGDRLRLVLVTPNGNGDTIAAGIESFRFSDGTRSLAQLLAGLTAVAPTTGNDKLAGSLAADSLDGLAGDDEIDGGPGDDTLAGSGGSDELNGGEGNDSLAGGDGIDYLDGGLGDNRLDGGDGNDFLDGSAGNDTLIGGPGNDYLNARYGNNLVDAGNGDDTVYSYAGRGTLLGGAGNDYIQNDDGDHLIDGGDGNDEIFADDGNDTITGGAGHDEIYADDGSNHVDGGAGSDTIFGGGHADTLDGGLGSDELWAGHGGDVLRATALDLSDPLAADAAPDTLYGEAGNDTIDGRGGRAIAAYWGSQAVVVDLAAGTADDGQGGTDTLIALAGARGSAGNDSLVGTRARAETLEGGDGNDTLRGGSDGSGAFARDRLDGGNGDDRLSLVRGSADGGAGSDRIELLAPLAQYTVVRAGDNAVRLLLAATQEDLTLGTIEQVVFAGGTTRSVAELHAVAQASAPALDGGFTAAVGGVAEGDAAPAGTSIAALLPDGAVVDADGAVEAIAVTAVDPGLGTWQYRLGGSGPWLAIRADLLNRSRNELALHLGPADLIRLLPFGTLNGELATALVFRAWDQSNAVQAGQYAAITTTGGNSAYSAQSGSASAAVLAANDAPSFAPPRGGAPVTVAIGRSYDEGRSVLVQPDGHIVVAGYSATDGPDSLSVLRLRPDGSLDDGFNGNGRLVLAIGRNASEGYHAAQQADGRLVLTGWAVPPLPGAGTDLFVARLNGDGTLDTGFADGGIALVAVSATSDDAYRVALQADGRIVVAGRAYIEGAAMLARLNADGSLDSGFNGSGKLVLPWPGAGFVAYGLVIQPDGRIVVAGEVIDGVRSFGVVRLNADGSLDTTFGTGGRVNVVTGTTDGAYDLVLQPDGKLVAAGYSRYAQNNYAFAAVRLNPDGSLDTGFNGSGTALLQAGSYSYASGASLQADGKLLLAGSGLDGEGFDVVAVLRLNADGTPDAGFGSAGQALVRVAESARALSVTTQPDGRIVVAGQANDENETLLVVRLLADGRIDPGFGATAVPTLGSSAAYTEGGAAVALDAAVAVFDAELAALAGGSGNYRGASLTLARSGNASADDRFGALGNLQFDGSELRLAGTAIGTLENGGGTLVLRFGSAATQARVDEALSSLSYANTNDAPPAGVTIAWRFDDGSGAGNALASGSTPVSITAVNDAPTGGVAITGEPRLASTLAAQATVGDADGLGPLAWQWLRNGVEIAGATAPQYTPVEADRGAVLAARVRYTDGGGTLETVTSADTAAVTGTTRLTGTTGPDTLTGGAGEQVIEGLDGDDRLDGGSGNDRLDGGLGDYDWLSGGAGNDTIDGGPRVPLSFGFNVDIVRYDASSGPLTIDLNAGTAVQDGFTDTLSRINAVFGGGGNDSIRGIDGPAIPRGETLRGGGGDDTIDGGTGVDAAEFLGNRSEYTVTRVNATTWTVRDNNTINGNDGIDTLVNIERFVFADEMLSVGPRAEEVARVAFVLWTTGIIAFPALFSRGYSYYDNSENGQSFEMLSLAALTFWTDDSDARLAQRLSENTGANKSPAQFLATINAAGGGLAGRGAAVREAAFEPAITTFIATDPRVVNGIVSFNFLSDFGTLFELLPGG